VSPVGAVAIGLGIVGPAILIGLALAWLALRPFPREMYPFLRGFAITGGSTSVAAVTLAIVEATR